MYVCMYVCSVHIGLTIVGCACGRHAAHCVSGDEACFGSDGHFVADVVALGWRLRGL